MIPNNVSSERNIKMIALVMATIFCLPSPTRAQGGTANYFYDANGRLTGVLSPTGEAAIYSYDPAGNFTSITRRAANELSILDFTPGTGSATTLVTIYGTGFSATPAANIVKFNGVAATVTAATNIRLDVIVPNGATTGPINVANVNGTINSIRNFFVPSSAVEFTKLTSFGEATPFTFNKTVNRAPLITVGVINFDGVSGQRVSVLIDEIVLLPGVAFSGLSPYAQVSIITPSGSPLTSFPIQDFTQYTTIFGFLNPVALPETGTYSILVDPNDNISTLLNQTGQYALSGTTHLYDVGPDIAWTIAASGLPTPVGFSAPGQNAILTFAGLSGQRICLQASQDIATQFGTDVKLYAPGAYPNGSPLVSQVLTSSFFVDTITLAGNGTYTILVDPQFNKTRTATLTLYDVPPDVAGTLTVGAAAQTITIPSVGQAANLNFSVPGSGNQQVTIHLRNLAIGPFSSPSTLTLNTQVGGQVFTQTINSNADYDIPRTLSPGTYTLKIDPQQSFTGSLNINLTIP